MSTVIVGGGISGLALGLALRGQQQDVRVLEASARAGGYIGSREERGFVTETGPNGFLDREPATLRLVDRLGLTDRLRIAAPSMKRRFVYTRGALREVPASPPKLLRSNVLPVWAKLRLAMEPLSGRAREEDESLASFGRRHLGEVATSVLVDAMQSGTFAGDVERLSIRACYPKMAALEQEHRSLLLGMLRLQKQRKASGQVREGGDARGTGAGPEGALCTFTGGLQTLVEACARRLEGALELGAKVTALVPAGKSGGGWSLQVERDGRMEEIKAERLVLATPAHASAELLAPIDRALSAELAAIEYAPIAAVHLGFEPGAFSVPPDGFGFLVPHAEGRRLLGVIFVSSIFPWRASGKRALLTCMVGGAKAPALARLPEADLIALAREELQQLLGIQAAPTYTRVDAWARGIPQYNVGHLARLERIDAAARKWPGLFLTGNAYRGVGINDCIREAEALAAGLAAPSAVR